LFPKLQTPTAKKIHKKESDNGSPFQTKEALEQRAAYAKAPLEIAKKVSLEGSNT
jgi:hypothetical protein